MPDYPEFSEKLTLLLNLSQALLTCDPAQSEDLLTLLAAREPLLQWFDEADSQNLTNEERHVLQQLVFKIQETNTAIEQRFEQIQQQQAAELRSITEGKHALSQYKFPAVPESTGVENQG